VSPFDDNCDDCQVCDDKQAAEQWDAILADDVAGPVTFEDRRWAAQSFGDTEDVRQEQARQWFRIGRKTGHVGVPLSVPLALRELPWCADALQRGHALGEAEHEVGETMAAFNRLPVDDRPAPEREV
jgi:hypothetical protein